MYVFWMLAVGLVTGIGARLVLPGRAGGLVMTITLGLAGSILAGFFARALGFYRVTVDVPGIVASVLGATLVLVAFRFAMGRRTRSVP